MNISVVLPTFNSTDPILQVLNALNNQILKPNEIIIVDSCITIKIQTIIESYESSIPILYHWVPKAFPGHARNIGVKQCKNELIAFLDSKTIPELDWLNDYLNFYKNNNLFIQGKTFYLAESFFQNIVKSATFGNHSHKTLPGSLMQKSFFKDLNGFNQTLRAGEDQQFINKVYNYSSNFFIPDKVYLNYKGLPNTLPSCLFKYFIYSIYTAKINIQISVKYAYLILFLILIIILNHKLEHISFFFNIKLHLDFIFLFFILALSFSNFILLTFGQKLIIFKNIIYFQIISFSIICYLIYIYYNKITIFFENFLDSIPHLGKIYFITIIVFSLIYRGLYLPLKRNININSLLPFKWINISLIGLGIDIVKAPGYIVGGFISPLIYLINIIKNKNH